MIGPFGALHLTRPAAVEERGVPRRTFGRLPATVRLSVVLAVLVAAVAAALVAAVPVPGPDAAGALLSPGLWLLAWLAVVAEVMPHTRPLRGTRMLTGFAPSLPIAVAAVLAYGPVGVFVFALTGIPVLLLLRREWWRLVLSLALCLIRGCLTVAALAVVTGSDDWGTAVTTWRVLPLAAVAGGVTLAIGWAADRWLRRLLADVGLTAIERRWLPRRASWYLPFSAPIPAALAVTEPALLPLLGLAIVAAQLGVAKVASQTALAGLDPLTGIANRAALSAALHRRLTRRQQPPATGAPPVLDDTILLLADLDRFKEVNDVHGHLVGDQVLAVVGERIQTAVRAADLPARMGGDEFAVLLERGGRPGDLAGICARIRAAVAEPLLVDGVTFRLQLTFGWAAADGVESATELIARADLDLYRQKADRKGGRVGRHRAGADRPPEPPVPVTAPTRAAPTWSEPTWSGSVHSGAGRGTAPPG